MNSYEQLLKEIRNITNLNVLDASVDSRYLELIRIFPLVEIKDKEHHCEAIIVVEKIINYLNLNQGTENNWLRDYLSVLSLLIQNFEKTI